MKYSLVAVTLIFLFACQNSLKTDSDPIQLVDSTIPAAPLSTEEVVRNAYFDTVGIYQAPVMVLSAKLVSKKHSNYKDIHLSWKNVSDKKIAAIRFKWYGLNAFGEPADMGGTIVEGFGTGFVDRPLGLGKTDAGTWSIMSPDGKKVVMAWPYEVAFEDGTKWKTK